MATIQDHGDAVVPGERPGEQTGEQTAGQPAEQPAAQHAEHVSEQTTADNLEKTTEPVPQQASSQLPGAAFGGGSEQVPAQPSQSVPEQVPQQVPEHASEEVTEQKPEQNFAQVPAQQAFENTSGQVTESAPHEPEQFPPQDYLERSDQIPVGRTLDVDRKSSETDSALGSDTFSSSVTDYRVENGRRYHAYHDGAYYLPNDEIEIDRLDLQHHIWRMTLHGALYISPLPEHTKSVLDLGTGTGIWAIEYAQEHPHAHVTGVDLSPIQPPFVPPNCNFIIDNVEADWVYDKKFDFVHSRMLVFGLHDWPRCFRQAWEHLKPGGWVEMQEGRFPIACDDGSAALGSPFLEWSDNMLEATRRVGLDINSSAKFTEQLREQGFINIRSEAVKWAIGGWPKGKLEKEIGRWTLENCLQGLQAVTMALYTRHLGWSREAVELYLVGVRKQAMDPSSHVYITMTIHSAQKPYNAVLRPAEE